MSDPGKVTDAGCCAHPDNTGQTPAAAKSGWIRRLGRYLWGLLRQRCPRCLEGRLFRDWRTMNDPCPVCGLIFQREEGYFLGAMYASFVLSAALVVPAYLLITMWRP